MKLLQIILKNFKLLIRSKLSALVIILGPLLVIFLVGLSFSTTSTFNLNIGIIAPESDLANSYIGKLNSADYSITRFDEHEMCVENIKQGQVHTCIVFPPEFAIENEKTNLVTFYVDKSRINLAYLIISTLTESFENRSTEISLDLVSQITSVLFSTRKDIYDTNLVMKEVIGLNKDIAPNAEAMHTQISALDLSTEADTGEFIGALTGIEADINEVKTDIVELTDDGFELIEDLNDYGLDANQSDYVEDIESDLNQINSTIKSFHNATILEIQSIVSGVGDIIGELTQKLENVKSVNTNVLPKIADIKEKSEQIKEKSDSIESSLSSVISKIDEIEVTSAESITSPILTTIMPVTRERTNLSYMFPSLLIMLIMFIGLILPAILIIIEKSSKAYFRIFTTPTNRVIFDFSYYLTSLILLFVQIAIILLVSEYYFELQLFAQWQLSMIILLLISTFFIIMGMFIGYIFNTEEMATLAAVSIAALFLLTSGLIFPLESMPKYIIEKAMYNPFLVGSELFKRSILFGTSFSGMQRNILLLFGYTAVLLTTIVAIHKLKTIRFDKIKFSKIKSIFKKK
ncbi:ABC transporter permease [Candidatus Woesearchaeota archaeon]|nr:ABC transporter permease [Candidatus Woesearchaeota archaeon]